MEQVLIVLLVIIGGVFAIAYYHSQKKREKQRLRIWRQVAEERGGIFHEPKSALFTSESGAIEVEQGETVLYMDTYSVRSDRNRRQVVTRVRAALLVPDGPRFRVFPETLLASLGKAFGGQDVELGEEEFDDHFVVKTRDADQTRAMWNEGARELMLKWFRDGRVECDGVTVTLTVDGGLDERFRINMALDLVGELANADLFGLDELERLPGARYIPPEGPWNDRSLPLVELDEVVLVEIGPVLNRRRKAVTQVEAEGITFDGELDHTVGGDDESFELGETSLPDGAEVALRAVGSGRLVVRKGRASFTWRKIVTNRRKLLAGVRLIASFGVAPGRGAYR